MEDKKKFDGDKCWKIFVAATSFLGALASFLSLGITVGSLLG